MIHFVLLHLSLLFVCQSVFASNILCHDVFNTHNTQSLNSSIHLQRLKIRQFSLNEFPTVAAHNIQILQDAGRNNYIAKVDNSVVFLKKLKSSSLREAAWLQELNKIGLGVQFHGITQINGHHYMIIADASGVNTQMPMAAPDGFILTAHTIAEMKRQVDLLAAHSIYPIDLQFQISLDQTKITLIDPEFFEVRDESNRNHHSANTLLNSIIMLWSMDGRTPDSQ